MLSKKYLALSLLAHALLLFGLAGPNLQPPQSAAPALRLVLVQPSTPNDNAAPSGTKQTLSPKTITNSLTVPPHAVQTRDKPLPKVAQPIKQASQKPLVAYPSAPLNQTALHTSDEPKTSSQNGPTSDFSKVPGPSTSTNPEKPLQRTRQIILGSTKLPLNYEFYTDAWRTKVENIGQRMYPSSAAAATPNPVLTLSVILRADGQLGAVRVTRSSGNADLDQAAIRIVEAGAPFAPFPPDIRAEADQIEIVRTWRFQDNARA